MKSKLGHSKWVAMLGLALVAGVMLAGATESEASSAKVEYCCYYQPDLEVTKIKLSTSKPKRDKPFNVMVTIRNRGTEAVYLRYYGFYLGLFLDAKHCVMPYDYADYSQYVNEPDILYPGDTKTVTFRHVYYYDKGTRYLRVFVDQYNYIYECNEANNQRTAKVKVQ